MSCLSVLAGLWFSSGPPVFSTNKIDCHHIHVTEILLKMALNPIKPNQTIYELIDADLEN
jgi:hypothetical protein